MSNDEVLSTLNTAQLSVPKSSVGVFTLPCGYLDDDDVLHTDVEIREMTGHEEDLLISKLVPTNRKMAELTARCITRLGSITDKGVIASIVPKLLVGDRVFAMFAIRRVTLGDEYRVTVKCPSCKSENSPTVDLSELKEKPMPEPKVRVWDILLPSKTTARLKTLDGDGQDRIEKLTKKNEGDTLSIGMLIRTEMLTGLPPTLQSVKNLSSADRTAIRNSFEEHDGGVDTSIDFECPNCGYTYSEDLDVQAGFFFPAATRKT